MSAIGCSTLARPNAEFAVHERFAVSIETREVHLPISRAEVIRTFRQGDDLVVEVADGRLLLVEGYFAGFSMADGSDGDDIPLTSTPLPIPIADRPVLLTTEGPDGQMAVLDVNADGMAAAAQPTALGRLDEMFSVDGDFAEEPLLEPGVQALQESSSALIGPLLVGGTITLAAVALTSSSDSDRDGSNPDAAALGRINSGSASLDDWGRFGVEVAAGASAADRENLLHNLMDTVAELGGGQSLSSTEVERIAYAVERASTVNVDQGYARVVSVDFDPTAPAGPAARSLGSPRNTDDDHDSLDFGVDTDGDGTADQTASFDTGNGYRPVGARFFGGTEDNGTHDEEHQYHYRDENELAVRADIDGDGTGDANGTVDRIERDTDGDGRADSVAVSDNDDGTVSRMEFIDPNNPAQVAAMARINAGSAIWNDFRTAGVDVDDLSAPSNAILQDLLDVLAIAKEAGNGGQNLTLLQVQGIVSLLHYNYALRNTELEINTVTNEIKGVDQIGFAALGDADEWHYEEWSFDNLANNRAEFAVATGDSDQFPSQLVPEKRYELDFSRMLGFRQISASIDFDADGAYDVRYIGEYSEDDGDGNYDLVSAEILAGGTYNMDSLPSSSLNLGEIFDLGELESITLHEEATSITISLESLLEWAESAAGEPGHGIKIYGDGNDSVAIEGVEAGADVMIDGETFTPFEVVDPSDSAAVVVTFYVDPEIAVA